MQASVRSSRERQPVLANRRVRLFSTVFSLIPSVPAICGVRRL
ncbi:hypothetical protein JOF56_002381 [Kibdelosporangium banguiense]|uniref:Uncharacterized protein n=1 Tax=Kibdelosporangium banguiense TaxID=1365924 RepID=A0ABS4TCD2_9PSEU|nr:hypothetical protein [Kibdelosporangium banguiense]